MPGGGGGGGGGSGGFDNSLLLDLTFAPRAPATVASGPSGGSPATASPATPFGRNGVVAGAPPRPRDGGDVTVPASGGPQALSEAGRFGPRDVAAAEAQQRAERMGKINVRRGIPQFTCMWGLHGQDEREREGCPCMCVYVCVCVCVHVWACTDETDVRSKRGWSSVCMFGHVQGR
eukprot:151317-Chlamydomonas_euryale.AAC.9